jgi:plastocyanin
MGRRSTSIAPLLLALALIAAPAPAQAQAQARTFTFRAAPQVLAGYETGIGVTRRIRTPQLDGFVTGMSVHVVDARGRRVPQQRVMLHHVLFLNRGRFTGDRWGTDCTTLPREPFYGTGEEDQPLHLPDGYGYRVRAGDRWTMAWMVMNHTHRDERVSLRYDVTVDPLHHLTPVTPYWVTTSCNRDRIYSVAGGGAPGSVDRHSRLWTVPQDGRIVAAAGHAHGGARSLTVAQPRCGGRALFSSEARYGTADDPIYHVSPVLHEPSPRSLSWALSASGWRVQRGEQLDVSSLYDAALPHMKVMGIMHVYVARDHDPDPACAPLPTDAEQRVEPFLGAPGRVDPPPVTVQLSRRQPSGPALAFDGAPGALRTLAGDATFAVRGFGFHPANVSVPAGARIRWRFGDRAQHDVTVADGPRGFASEYETRGHAFATRLDVPGDYRIFCSLHPVDMSQVVHVRAPGE